MFLWYQGWLSKFYPHSWDLCSIVLSTSKILGIHHQVRAFGYYSPPSPLPPRSFSLKHLLKLHKAKLWCSNLPHFSFINIYAEHLFSFFFCAFLSFSTCFPLHLLHLLAPLTWQLPALKNLMKNVLIFWQLSRKSTTNDYLSYCSFSCYLPRFVLSLSHFFFIFIHFLKHDILFIFYFAVKPCEFSV